MLELTLTPELALLLLIIALGLAFDFINGFHDTANAIATVVATRVLSPGWAVLMAGVGVVMGGLERLVGLMAVILLRGGCSVGELSVEVALCDVSSVT